MPAHNQITVVTRFNPRQTGYLDFQYRISALEKAGMLDMVISNISLAKHELHVPDDKFVHISGGVGGALAQWRYFYKVKKYCKKTNKKNVLLLHSSLAPLSLILSDCKTILYWNEHPSHIVETESGTFISRWKNKYLLKEFYRGARAADIIMPIGEHHFDDLVNAGCQTNRLNMIYMGVDELFRNIVKHKIDCEHLRLIYTGSVKKDRGRDIMLEAVSLLRKQDKFVYLTIVGASDNEMAICNEMCRDLKINDRVTVVGRVPGGDIPYYIQQADMGICIWADKPYWRFNPPTKLFEYMVAGLPVLASNMVTHTQYVNDQVNGLIFDYDAESMAATIAKCINDKSLIPKLRKNLQYNCEGFLWKNIEPDFIGIIKRVIRQ